MLPADGELGRFELETLGGKEKYLALFFPLTGSARVAPPWGRGAPPLFSGSLKRLLVCSYKKLCVR